MWGSAPILVLCSVSLTQAKAKSSVQLLSNPESDGAAKQLWPQVEESGSIRTVPAPTTEVGGGIVGSLGTCPLIVRPYHRKLPEDSVIQRLLDGSSHGQKVARRSSLNTPGNLSRRHQHTAKEKSVNAENCLIRGIGK